MGFKTLYKLTATGATQFWKIEVKGNVLTETWGQVGGKEQSTSDTIRVGKNQGRVNETTPEMQAKAEAQSKWEGKIKKGYVEKIDRAEAGETDHAGGTTPMLAHTFAKQGHKLVYPCYSQPKLDGHRCLTDAKANLWSRTRKPITSSPHITAAIRGTKLEGAVLDGELYTHTMKNDFEKISHLVRQQTPTDGHEEIQYHIYDCVMKGSFKERYAWLKANFPKNSKTLVLVETLEVASEDELIDSFNHFLSEGYEGAIARNMAGQYEGKRSTNLIKVKEFLDSEYKVIGIEEGRGKLQGHVGSFICQTKDGQTFNAKMKGELSTLKKYYDNEKLWKGKTLTVQYQGLSTYGIPRFPIGLRFREKE